MTTAFWDEVQIQFINDTAGKFNPSEPTAFRLQACDVSTTTVDEYRRTVLPFTVNPTNSQAASLFLFLDIGVIGHHLVVWIWMDPQTSGLDVKAGVFQEIEQFDEALLEKLSRNDVQSQDIGFSPRSLWPLEDSSGKRFLGISASANEVILDANESLSDYWNYHRPQVTIHIRDPVYFQRQQAEAHLKKDQPHAFMKINGGIGHSFGEPVHENITLAALLAANVIPAEIDSNVTYDSVIGGLSINVGKPDVWEFIRGVIWNDDPACALFNDQADNNGSFGFGADWGLQYGEALGPGNIIHRSHYGDLQFLHAMGAHVGEDPAVTKGKLMRWLETMYRLSVGDEVSAGDAINKRLGEFFDDNTTPRGSETLRSLIMGTTPSYRNVKIDRRALGICMHIIQDSYALGHTRRKLLNPLSDMEETTLKRSFWEKFTGKTDDTVKIFPRTPASFGKVHNFHCYTGQDKRHGLYDEVHNATLVPSQLTSFNAVIGGKDAVEKCTILAKHWAAKASWSVIEPWLDSEVFALSRFATPSDTRVDEGLGSEPSD